jgi:histidine triad (HIT) family protein
MGSADCIFCAIVAGTAHAHRVAEDEHVLAFMDLFPVAEGHALVIPKAHAENIFEIDDASVRAEAALTRRLALAIRQELAPDGLAIYQANGAAALQTVFHYHTHLIPRSAGDTMGFHGRAQGKPEELAAMANRLAARLRQV